MAGWGISVAAGGIEHVSWPPAYDDGAATLDADGDVFASGLRLAASIDGTNGTMFVQTTPALFQEVSSLMEIR